MPRVACFAVDGIELWFNSDDHLPPHFHAEKNREWGVRVRFLREPDEMVEVVYTTRARRPSQADLKAIKAEAEANRAKLYEQMGNSGAREDSRLKEVSANDYQRFSTHHERTHTRCGR